jgi:hypothetical protein
MQEISIVSSFLHTNNERSSLSFLSLYVAPELLFTHQPVRLDRADPAAPAVAGNFVVGRAVRDTMSPMSLSVGRWAVALASLLPFASGAIRRHWRAYWKHREAL